MAKLSIEFVGSKHAPAVWSLDKSIDYGKTWRVLRYFVKNPDDCELLGIDLATDGNYFTDYVTCSPQKYQTNRPLVIDLTKNQQLITNKVKSEEFDEWTRATNVRLHFYGLKIDLKYFPLLKNPNITETVSLYKMFGIEARSSESMFVVFSIFMR